MSNKARKTPPRQASSLRWRNLPPHMRRKISAGYFVLIAMAIGVYLIFSNYGVWFGTKSQDGFKIDQRAAAVTMASYEELPAPDGENILYVPVVNELQVIPDGIEQHIEIGNHPQSAYYMAYVITVKGEEKDYPIYRSKLFGPGLGSGDVNLGYAFSSGSFPAKIEYRYYHKDGALNFIASQTRDITIVAGEPPAGKQS